MDRCNLSFEPMEIDLSSSSSEILATSIKEETEHDTVDCRQITNDLPEAESLKPYLDGTEKTSIKVYHIKLDRKLKRSSSSFKVIISALMILCLATIVYQAGLLHCSDKINLVHLNETMTHQLYGQTEAINSIIDVLSMNATTKVIFLCGGTGVGKTFATSMIMEKLLNSSNLYHYTMPGFTTTFSADFLLGLTLCKDSMLIVDDLTPKEIYIKPVIKQVIEKSENLAKNLTVILVFNCDNISDNFNKKCDDAFYDNLEESFRDIVALKKVITFKPLNNDHLKKCIERELGDNKFDEYQMNNIMKNFDVTLDGCKGVHNKVKFLNLVQT